MNHKVFRPIAIIVLSFFLWTFGGVFDIAQALNSATELQSDSATVKNSPKSTVNSQKSKIQRPEEKFQKAIQEIENIVRQSDSATELQNIKQQIKTKKTEIESLDTEIKKQFKETEEKIKSLPEVIKQRHKDFVAKYDSNLKELTANLEAIEKAKDKAEVEAKVEEAKKFLEKVNPPKKHIPLDPNKLPHRTAEIKKYKIEKKGSRQLGVDSSQKKTKTKSLSPNTYDLKPVAKATSPTDADLAETIEVQFTEDIKAKAEELGKSPVKIYEYVRNNIEYVPTYGSIQGADMCLQTKQCNDFDTASLLIALLRYSGIHARYIYGTIEVPIEKVKNWVGGFTDSMTALNFVASSRIPVIGITEGGQIKYAQIEHMHVEAYLPYGNYRGTMIDQSIMTWIPMDGSYKQYDYSNSLDVVNNVTFDESSYLSKVVDSTPVEFYLEQIQSYLDANIPDKTTDDVKMTKGIKEENLELLSSTLPYKTIDKIATLSELTDNYRYKVETTIPDVLGSGLSYQVSIPEIIGKRFTISYIPATSADEQLIDQYGGFYNVPAYLLTVKPAVKIEGDIVALGDEILVGTEQELDISLIYPDSSKTDRIAHAIKAGGYYAIGLVAKGLKEDLIEQRFEKYKEVIIEDYPDSYNDPLLGEVLNMTILRYFYNMDESKTELSEVSHYAYNKDISEGLAAKNIDVSYIYGVPYKITPSTSRVDIAREVSNLLPLNGDRNKKIEIVNILGLTSSILENQTLEQMMSIDSISAVKCIQLANEKGIPIHYIDQDNLMSEITVISVSEDVKTSIRDAINQGNVVTIPETDLQYNSWYGIGWIAEDPTTGAGAYMISGYLMGGETTKGSLNKNPACNLVDAVLFDDIYRAIAYIESKWSQFRQTGEPETSGSAYGMMQIERRSWKDKNWPGTTSTIDWDSVLNDWTYNVALGKAIYEWNLNNIVPKDLENAGITNPTAEQEMLDALSRYNNYEPYYLPSIGGEYEISDPCPGCDYADSVNKIYKERTWENSKKLKCGKQ